MNQRKWMENKVIKQKYFSGTVLGGDVGLAISSAMMLSGMFQWGVRQSAEVESQMTSVERVLEYSNIDPETPIDSKKSTTSKDISKL